MRWFFSLLGVLIIIGLSLGVLGVAYLAKAPGMLSRTLSEKIGTAVDIGGIELGWNFLGIENFSIANPQGSILSDALIVKKISFLTPWKKVLGDPIEIDQIVLDNIFLGLEFDSPTGTSGNWTQLMERLKRSTPPSKGKSRKVLIRSLVLNNIHVDVVYRHENQKVKHLQNIPRLELTNISSEEGVPMDQILNSVLGEMLKSVFIKENLKNMLDQAQQVIPKQYQPYVETFKHIFQ